jgi:serine protease AprX
MKIHNPRTHNSEGKVRVLVELRVNRSLESSMIMGSVKESALPGLTLDESFKPTPINKPRNQSLTLESSSSDKHVIVRGEIDENKIKELESASNVVKVWKDTPIAPFSCPIAPCDNTFGNPAIGNIDDVAKYLGVTELWNKGIRGKNIVIAIVDGGITAKGRNPKPGETPKIDNVINGYPDDWGTTASAWGDHGNMTAFDALGMAPDTKIYDIRISDGGTILDAISNAFEGFNWAINQHKVDGTPHILSNSWGIYKENWDRDYANDPDHPFTRKVIEAINEGIIVLFAAGNCGESRPDGRCGLDNGPGRSIWGANGHPSVITVGAVNLDELFVGYSSQGPAALDEHKPDFCSITHFAGYFPSLNSDDISDGGTSAATPIAAGVIALFKQGHPSCTQEQIKKAIIDAAKDIGPAGWDKHSGAGILRGKDAFDKLG